MHTDEHLGTFTEYGISKNVVSMMSSYLDITSAFVLSITNRSFYCSFNNQLDWIKYYYYTTVCCRRNSGRKKFDKHLLRNILSLSLINQDNIYFSRAPLNCLRYLKHHPITQLFPPLELQWQHSFHFFNSEDRESTVCPFSDAHSSCSSFCFMEEELIICTRIIPNHPNHIGHHKHFKIQDVKIPILYVFEHVRNSCDELIFFLHSCSFDHYDKFPAKCALEISTKSRSDTMYFFFDQRGRRSLFHVY